MGFILYIFLFFTLTLLQVSFFPHFFSSPYLNFILIGIIFINIIEKRKSKGGLILSVLAGFFLDIFSGNLFGLWTFVSLATSVFIKFIIKKYFGLDFKMNFHGKIPKE